MRGVFLVALALAGGAWGIPVAAQEGEALDCAISSLPSETKDSLGAAMAGSGEETANDLLFRELAVVTDACITRHGIPEMQKSAYFDYSLARVSREWLALDIARRNLSTSIVDKALDFGVDGANPDLSIEISEDQMLKIVQAYIESGIDIEAIEGPVWEKVGAYAAATSIYWNNRKLLTR